mmetsp:Transcript_25190/g.40426  ORF Transcript_25190/g.40426 Transcript_25190/m.40426 type:complete len:109 (+) Transcript_25190:462-788(+)
MFAGVPGVNSPKAIFNFSEKAVLQAELNRLHREHKDKFLMVPQSYFSSHKEFFYSHKYPAVLKLGTAHAGLGKIKAHDEKQLDDVRNVLVIYFSVSRFDLGIRNTLAE